MDVSENIGTPQIINLKIWFCISRPSILGAHPYFGKHLYIYKYIYTW